MRPSTRASPPRSRAVPGRRRRRRRPARPRLHRHAPVAAGLGRAPRRRRASRCACRACPGTAPAGRSSTARAGPTGTRRPSASCSTWRPPGTASSSAGCRWAARSRCAWRRSTRTTSPGSSWSTRPCCTRTGAWPCCPSCATSSARSRRSATTSASRARPSWPTSARRCTRRRRRCRLLAAVKADLTRVSAPLLVLHSPQDHVVPAVLHGRRAGRGVLRRRQDVVLPGSYHVATLDHDAPLVFERSLGFVQRVTAGCPRVSGDERRGTDGGDLPAGRRRPLRRHRRPLPRRRAGPAAAWSTRPGHAAPTRTGRLGPGRATASLARPRPGRRPGPTRPRTADGRRPADCPDERAWDEDRGYGSRADEAATELGRPLRAGRPRGARRPRGAAGPGPARGAGRGRGRPGGRRRLRAVRARRAAPAAPPRRPARAASRGARSCSAPWPSCCSRCCGARPRRGWSGPWSRPSSRASATWSGGSPGPTIARTAVTVPSYDV